MQSIFMLHRGWRGLGAMFSKSPHVVCALVLAGCSTGATQNASIVPPRPAVSEDGAAMAHSTTAHPPETSETPVSLRPDHQAAPDFPSAMPDSPAAPVPSPQPFAPAAPRITYSSTNVDGPYVAMTFDDGPHGVNTPRLLDILKQRGIKATFYVVGRNVEMHPDIMRRIAAEGHEIGNHSWSHPFFTKISDASVRSQLQRTEDAILRTAGVQPKTMRPPYGAINSRQKNWIHDDFGYPTIMWSVDPQDWRRPGPSVVSNRIVSNARSGSIILAHDIHAPTIDAMPAALDALMTKGYRFVTVSELIDLEQGKGGSPPALTRLSQ